MHRPFTPLPALLVLLIACVATARTPDDLGSTLDTMRTYRFGDSQAALVRAEALVSTVPALERLMHDDEVGEAAIGALTRIPGEAAGAALLQGLEETGARHRIARVNALGARREAIAVDRLAQLATSADDSTADAAIAALGRIGSIEAGKALLALRADAGTAEAIVTCADHLAMTDEREAAELYRRALAMNPAARHGAILGLCGLGDQAVWRTHVRPLLESESPADRGFAASLVRTTRGAEGTRATCALLDTLQGESRAVLITALGERGDRAALAPVHRQARSRDVLARLAAIEALGALGDGSVIDTLARAEEGEAALASLGRLQSPGIDEAIARRQRTGPASLRVRLIEALVIRQAREQASALIPTARDPQPAVRDAAIDALTALAGPSEVAPLVALLLHVPDDVRSAAVAALVAATRHDSDTEGRVDPIVTALHAERTIGEREALLQALGALGGSHALSAVREYVQDDDLGTAAITALAAWPDEAPAGDLRAIAARGGDEAAGIAFDGFLRMAGMLDARSAADSVRMHEDAMRLARSDEQRASVLNALAGISTVGALAAAEKSLGREALNDTAANAVLHIAASLPPEQRDRALLAVHRARTRTNTPAFDQRAAEVVDAIERNEGFVTDWHIAGPFTDKDTPTGELLARPFAPEQGSAATVEWRAVETAHVTPPGRIDLDRAIGGGNRVAYARTSIWSDTARDVRFDLGSDDGIKLWLNDDVLHENNVMRGHSAANDRANGRLRFGWNTLLVKVSQGGGGWAFSCRLRTPEGLALEGISAMAGAGPHTPPPGATVLFGGNSTDAWSHGDGSDVKWDREGDEMIVRRRTGSIQTRERFEDMILHVEFMCPDNPDAVKGQGRSNSGVYLQGRYEVQVLDSFGLEPMANGCGAIYSVRAPTVNAARAPGEWQSYLIDFKAPRWSPENEKLAPAMLTVVHNGVVIHDRVSVPRSTGAGAAEGPTPGHLFLQDHGNPVRFRNIWAKVRPVTWEGPDAPGFERLFDGTTLNGWTQRGGKATYTAEDGAIVGRTAPNQPNSFLCTEELYGDFVLELEFKVDDELNSGVQIRSESTPEYRNGRVHGYQVEIDPSTRAWSAGIYDESRRGWLAPLETNEAARRAFRNGAWNRLRVVARGDRFQTFLNGVPAADLTDDMTAAGFIGLQVHGVGSRTDTLEVRWRDIRLKQLD
ncbi:MAG: family 16 glycoside hydrolase [Planctomycetota bacterium]|jgi:HEAT repeat protein